MKYTIVQSFNHTIILLLLLTAYCFPQGKGWWRNDDNAQSAVYPKVDDLMAGFDEREMTVSNWADQVGSKDFIQETETFRPLLTASALSGYPSLTFDNTDNDYMQSSSYSLGQPFTVYFVAKIHTYTTGSILRSNNNVFPIIAEGGGGSSLYMSTDFANFVIISQTTNTFQIFCCVFNGSSSVFQVNDNVETGNVGSGTNAATLYLCAGPGPSSFSNSEFVCFYLHSTAHDLATRTAVINWLNSKYGIY